MNNLKIRNVPRGWCCIASFIILLFGCATSPIYSIDPNQRQVALTAGHTAPYRIQSRDVLEVKFPLTEKHNQEVTVRPDGSIFIDVAGEIKAGGLTPAELAGSIKAQASARLRNPEVSVTVLESSQKVYVGGEVGSTGVIPFCEGLTVLQAIFERGGFRNTAQANSIFLVRTEKEQMNIIKLNMDEIVSQALSANDVIYVPMSDIAKANLAMRQFVRDMLPFSPGYTLP